MAMEHVELREGTSLNDLCGETLDEARHIMTTWPQATHDAAQPRTAPDLDQSPEPFLGFGIFLTPRPATPLGDTMVKCQGRNILASRVDYYYYEFVQALARIITVYGIYIGFLFVYLVVQYMRGVDSKMSEEYEQVFFGEMLHAVGAYMLLAVASFVALGRASRVGRMGALSAMSRVQGHHFMFSYLGAHHAKLCGTLSSLLSAQGFHVWMDSYRLENACSASRAYYEAARQSAYRVLCVNEHYLKAHQFSYTAIAALEHEYRPATVVHFDVKHDKWAGSDAGKRAIAAFRAEGFTVTTSPQELVQALDAILMSTDDYISAWWRGRSLAPVYGLTRPHDSIRVLSGREQRYSLGGSWCTPHGAITSGIHYLTPDASDFGRMVFIPAPAIIGVLVLLWGTYSFMAPFLHDRKPYVTFWWLFSALTMSATPSLFRLSDARFSHSAGLLPILLSRDELVRSHASLVLVSSNSGVAHLQQLRDFVAELGVIFEVTTIESLDTLDMDTFYCFHIETAEEASIYGQRFAGVGTERQLLSCVNVSDWGDDSEEQRMLMVMYSAILMGDHFASTYLETLGSKLTVFLHSRAMAAEVQAQQMAQINASLKEDQYDGGAEGELDIVVGTGKHGDVV